MLYQNLAHLLLCLRFLTRLTLPVSGFEPAPHAMPDFAVAAPMMPIAGALVGAFAAIILGLGMASGLPPWLSAPLALTGLILLTGALHEDALADCVDGFGGGATPERKLEIMKDSRIGAFGAIALVLSLYLRGASLASITTARGFPLAAGILIASAALSRSLALLPLALLPPARPTGAGFAASGFGPKTLLRPLLLAFIVSLTPLFAGTSLKPCLVACGLAGLIALGFTRFAQAQIHGQTGDVAGATQNLTEIAYLLVFAANS